MCDQKCPCQKSFDNLKKCLAMTKKYFLSLLKIVFLKPLGLCHQLLKRPIKWIKNNFCFIISFILFVTGLIFLISDLCGWHIFKGKDLFTAAGTIFSAAALVYAAHCYQKNSEEKISEFCLNQIQRYFSDTAFIIHKPSCNNIDWHHAINSLMAIENLYEKLTADVYIQIFLVDYISTAYKLVNFISSIDSYKYFFGIKFYKNSDGSEKTDKELYQESKKSSLSTSRISPDSLYLLACFIDRAARVSYDVDWNGALINNCINKSYFKKINKNYGEFTIFAGVEKIREYITAHKKCVEEEAKTG